MVPLSPAAGRAAAHGADPTGAGKAASPPPSRGGVVCGRRGSGPRDRTRDRGKRHRLRGPPDRPELPAPDRMGTDCHRSRMVGCDRRWGHCHGSTPRGRQGMDDALPRSSRRRRPRAFVRDGRARGQSSARRGQLHRGHRGPDRGGLPRRGRWGHAGSGATRFRTGGDAGFAVAHHGARPAWIRVGPRGPVRGGKNSAQDGRRARKRVVDVDGCHRVPGPSVPDRARDRGPGACRATGSRGDRHRRCP